MGDEFHLSDNGHNEEESQEVLQTVQKKLSELKREDGTLVTLTKQEVGLLKGLVNPPDKNTDDFINIALICDFLDEEEANRELEAFYEAQRLGMDTKYNIAHALSRAATNRKGGHSSSRVAQIMETMTHQKFTTNTQGKGKNDRFVSPRSPLY